MYQLSTALSCSLSAKIARKGINALPRTGSRTGKLSTPAACNSVELIMPKTLPFPPD